MKHLVIIVTALTLLVAAPAAHAAPAGQTQPTFGRGWSLPTYGKGSSQPTFGRGWSLPTYGKGSSQPTWGRGWSRPTYGRGWSLEALELRHTPRER